MQIDIDCNEEQIDINSLEKVLSMLSKYLKEIKEEAYLSIKFVDKDEIKELNKLYKGKDESTDVLSFPQDYDAKDNLILGDIVICLDELRENCIYFKEEEERELIRLLLHGLLHLIGYEHHSRDFKEDQMLIKQEEILKELEREIELEKSIKLFI